VVIEAGLQLLETLYKIVSSALVFVEELICDMGCEDAVTSEDETYGAASLAWRTGTKAAPATKEIMPRRRTALLRNISPVDGVDL
jgi:hypothetical protein